MTVPKASSDEGLASVSCPTPTSCLAVGWAAPGINGGGTQPGTRGGLAEVEQGSQWRIVATPAGAALAEAWNGHTWVLQPSASEGKSSQLLAVSCTPGSSCSAAGSFQAPAAEHILVERN